MSTCLKNLVFCLAYALKEANISFSKPIVGFVILFFSISIPLAKAGTISGPSAFCMSSSSYTTTYTATGFAGATNYSWSVPSYVTILSGQNTATITVRFSTSTAPVALIYVEARNGYTHVGSYGFIVTLYRPPGAAGAISGPATVCAGQSNVAYSVPNISNATIYSWILPQGASVASQSGNKVWINFSSSFTGGTIRVFGVAGPCGTGPMSSRTVSKTTPPGSPSNITGAPLVSAGQANVTYSVPAISNATGYQWTVPNGATITSGQNSRSIKVSFSSAFHDGNITVKGLNGGCVGPSAQPFYVTLSTLPGPTGPISSTNYTPCLGVSDLIITYSIQPVINEDPLGYKWSFGPGIIPLGNPDLGGDPRTNIMQVQLLADVPMTSSSITVYNRNAYGDGPASTLNFSIYRPAGKPGPISGPVNIAEDQIEATYSVPTIENASPHVWVASEGITKVSGFNTNTLTVNFDPDFTSGEISVFGVSGPCGAGPSSTLSIKRGPQVKEQPNRNYIIARDVLKEKVYEPSDVYGLSTEDVQINVTYFDGLGRPIQNVNWQSSPSKKDIIQPILYDEFGREKRKFLPYVPDAVDANLGMYRPDAVKSLEDAVYSTSEQYDFYQSAAKVAHDQKPYAETIFEASPLNRPLKAYGPGKDWYDNDKHISYHYLVNEDGTGTGQEKIIAWAINGSDVPVRYKNTSFNNDSGYYPSGSLTVKVTKGEGGMSVREYTNKQGQVVLKKVQEVKHSPLNLNNKEYWIQTYYIHDNLGNLRFVLTPELVNKLAADGSTNPSLTDLENFAFQYKYDGRQRLVEKHVPGGGSTYMVYDNWDRLVLAQDEEQQLDNKWSYTKYDAFNRPIITGIYTDSRTNTSIQTALKSETKRFESLNPQPGAPYVYTNLSFPRAGTEPLTATCYDSYDFLGTINWDAEGNDYSYVDDGLGHPTYNPNVNGQVTGSKIRIIGSSTWLNSVSYYDDYYNNIQTISEHALGGVGRTSSQYDFSGKLLKTIDAHTGEEDHTVTENFEYDHAGRLLKVYHKIDQGPTVLLVKNEYNELGELVDKRLHGKDASESEFLQSIDYRYNIRGWITHINNSTASNDGLNNNDDNDFFGMELYYNQLANGVSTNSDVLYNGNISAVKWYNNGEKGYRYRYDGANRLDRGLYFEHGDNTWANSGKYNVNNLSYDKNGNIMSLERYGASDTSPMDQLIYNYGTGTAQSNRLLKVVDSGTKEEGFKDGTNTDSDYAYYLNGNLKADKNKGIAEITYNHLNLPASVTWENGQQIVYTYDATGTKLKQEVKKGDTFTENYYVGDFFYTRELGEGSTKYEWGFNSGKQSWANNNHVANFSWNSEGYVQGTIVNADPNISSPVIDVPITENSIVKIRLKVGSGRNNAQLFFSTHASTGYSEAKSIRFNLISGSKGFNEYILDLSDNPYWTGRLRSFRLDPVHGATAGNFAVDYIKVIETTGVEGPQLQAVQHEEGRVMMMDKDGTGTFPEYQYHIKDHLGNVRLTFTSKPATENPEATLETMDTNNDRAEFLYYDQVTKINSSLLDHTNNGSSHYSMRLNGTENEGIGLAKSLAVMPGDRVKATVYGKYLDQNQNNLPQILANLMNGIANGVAPAGSVIDGLAVSEGKALPFGSLLDEGKAAETGPLAYLNYLVFDKDFDLIDEKSGFVALTEGKEDGTGKPHQKLETPSIEIEKQGYVYFYVSNDSPQPEVIFDDFSVKQIQSLVIQVDDYYPFGLTFNSFQRESFIANKYLYNGKELQDELGMGFYDYGARMYDPTIARWNSVDALSEISTTISPYAYVDNNPVNNIDPDGNMTVYGGNGAGYAFQYAESIAYDYYQAGMQKATITGAIINFAQQYPIKYASMVLNESIDNGFRSRLNEIHGYDNYKRVAELQASKSLPRDLGQWKEDGLNMLWGITPFGAAVNSYNSFKRGDYLEGVLHATTALAPFAGRLGSYAGELSAAKAVPQYTKSSLSLGRQMHTGYKAGLADGVTTFKEFTGIKGIRPDFVDFGTKTIYELKPFNPRQIQLGTKQLNNYKSIFEQNYGGTWKTVLDFY